MNIKLFSFSLFASSILASCVSTEILEPESPQDTSKQIVLTLTTPEEASTRADNGYKLRYTARIFKGSSANAWAKTPVDRQEIIDGEEYEGKEKNQIIFKVEPNDNYGIMVFADYVPVDYQPDNDGYYKDYFYNTKEKRIIMRTTPGSDEEVVSPEFFNNHNYDAFFAIQTIYKDIEEVVLNMSLKRATAQIVFRETSDATGDCSIIVNKLGVRRLFDQDINQTFDPPSSESSKNRGNINLPQTASVDEENKDLFFFYSLAHTANTTQHVSTEFKAFNDNHITDAYSVKEIPVKANYKTIVKGAFHPNAYFKPEEDTKAGDIILNLSADYDWEQQELSKSY